MQRCVTPTTPRGSNAGIKASEMPLSARAGAPDQERFWVPETILEEGEILEGGGSIDGKGAGRSRRPTRWLDEGGWTQSSSSLESLMRAVLGPTHLKQKEKTYGNAAGGEEEGDYAPVNVRKDPAPKASWSALRSALGVDEQGDIPPPPLPLRSARSVPPSTIWEASFSECPSPEYDTEATSRSSSPQSADLDAAESNLDSAVGPYKGPTRTSVVPSVSGGWGIQSLSAESSVVNLISVPMASCFPRAASLVRATSVARSSASIISVEMFADKALRAATALELDIEELTRLSVDGEKCQKTKDFYQSVAVRLKEEMESLEGDLLELCSGMEEEFDTQIQNNVAAEVEAYEQCLVAVHVEVCQIFNRSNNYLSTSLRTITHLQDILENLQTALFSSKFRCEKLSADKRLLQAELKAMQIEAQTTQTAATINNEVMQALKQHKKTLSDSQSEKETALKAQVGMLQRKLQEALADRDEARARQQQAQDQVEKTKTPKGADEANPQHLLVLRELQGAFRTCETERNRLQTEVVIKYEESSHLKSEVNSLQHQLNRCKALLQVHAQEAQERKCWAPALTPSGPPSCRSQNPADQSPIMNLGSCFQDSFAGPGAFATSSVDLESSSEWSDAHGTFGCSKGCFLDDGLHDIASRNLSRELDPLRVVPDVDGHEDLKASAPLHMFGSLVDMCRVDMCLVDMCRELQAAQKDLTDLGARPILCEACNANVEVSTLVFGGG